jgi:hypothetical protein
MKRRLICFRCKWGYHSGVDHARRALVVLGITPYGIRISAS